MATLSPLVGMLLRTRREAVTADAATNLSTRPFYNIRAVQVALGALAALVIVLTLLNLVELIAIRLVPVRHKDENVLLGQLNGEGNNNPLGRGWGRRWGRWRTTIRRIRRWVQSQLGRRMESAEP